MTKFFVKTSDFESSSLSEPQIKKLLAVLSKKVSVLQKQKVDIIKEMTAAKTTYRLKTIGDNFVMVITKEKSDKEELCVGYPFPIYTQEIKTAVSPFKVKYFIRGEYVRKAQKNHFLQMLREQNFITVSKEINSPKTFLETLEKNIRNLNPHHLNYIDLYRFVGDSFLSTYMLDIFTQNYPTEKVTVFSHNDRHLNGFYDAKPLSALAHTQNNDLFVFSDLLDIDDSLVQFAALTYQKDGIYIINSRNYFFIKNGNNIRLFTLKNRADVLLTNDNIFNYMKKCCKPFVRTSAYPKNLKVTHQSAKKIYINPYASLAQKSLTVDEIKTIVTELKKSSPKVEIFIPAGYNEDTVNYTQKIKKSIAVNTLPDNGIYDLYNKLKQNNFDLVITVDSALTHIITKLGIRNIILFKQGFWDSLSIQSLSAESPIAFCSAYYWQYPLVLKQNHENFAPLYNLMDYLNKPTPKVVKIQNLDLTQKTFSNRNNQKIKNICHNLGCRNKLQKEFIK